MLFKGHLRLPGDAGEGIPIDLTLEDVYLSLDSGGEELGEWRLDVVEIERLFSNQFSLLLDGEQMVFVAIDALGFAYDGLSFVEEVQSRLKTRRVFKGRKAKRAKVKKSRPEAPPEPEPERPTPAAPSVPDLPMPEVKPFFPEPVSSEAAEPEPVSSPAEEAPPPPPIAPAVPPPQPARRSVHPLGDPEEETVAPYLADPVEQVTPPAAAPVSPPVAQPPAADISPTPSEITPTPPQTEDDEDDLVIEDVTPYGYQAPVSMIPEQDRRPAAEPADEAVAQPPATPPLLEPEPEREVAPEPEPARSAVEPPAEPVDEAEPAAATEPASWPFAPRIEEPDRPVEVEPEAEPAPAETEPQTRIPQPSGRHTEDESKSRSSFFGRRKSKEPEPHDHIYESSKTVGGLTRSVCSVCGHVSFAGEDVYQNW